MCDNLLSQEAEMTQDSLTRARIVVDGIVQGVGFRYNVRFIAKKYSIVGYVKNLEDETVEIVCEGTRGNIDSFAAEIKGMEEPVRVERFDITFEEARREFKLFKVVTGELEDEMVEGFSTGMMYIRELRQETRENFGGLRSEIRGLRDDLKSFFDDRLKKIEGDISEIKSKLGMT